MTGTVEAVGLIAVGIFVSITGACVVGIREYGMTVVVVVVAAAAAAAAEVKESSANATLDQSYCN